MPILFQIIIWFLFLWSAYHLIRDLLTDVLGVHHPIIDVLHMRPRHKEHILGKFYQFWGLPLEVGVFLLSIHAIISHDFGLGGAVAVGFFATFFSFWAWSSF